MYNYTEENYKKLKEAFVADHYGGSVWEINEVALVAPAAVLLWSVLQNRQKFFDPYSPLGYVVDFLLHCCGILFATTVYADSPVVLLGFLVLPSVAIYFGQSAEAPRRLPKKVETIDLEDPDVIPIKPFITSYRGAMMIVTCVSILAVDFPVFPRRFAKTESLGTSLMDLGVGSFVFSAGVVSVRQQVKSMESDTPGPGILQRLNGAMRHSLPLAAMGFIRLYSVKSLDYVEHVSEYGVHWNFFFTLAAIGPFVAIFQSLFALVPSYAIIGYIVSLTQQMFFVYSDLMVWTLTAKREDFLSNNKEGLVSLAGYLAIFFAGQGIGVNILTRDQSPLAPETAHDQWVAEALGGGEKLAEMKRSQRQFTIISLAKWSLIWCVIYYFTTGYYGPRLFVSRRLGNMAYFVWVAAFNTVSLLIFCAIEEALFSNLYLARDKPDEKDRGEKATSKVLSAFNRNGLPIFLMANLLTGAINMSLPTIAMGDLESMAVLVGYMGVLTGTALALDHFDISIKL